MQQTTDHTKPTPGQRWINEAELELGLATLLESDRRTITLLFADSEESRCYALSSAPLVRISFAVGDTLTYYPAADSSQPRASGEISEVVVDDGLLFYRIDSAAGSTVVPEGWIDPYIPLHRPTLRLFSGQLDAGHWFELRHSARQAALRQAQDPLRGLSSGRIALLPHQLYIINEVANRRRPRVLLADEVGLGKTIEAGAIINSQLLNRRAERVLVVVPEALQHQWLVELRRRFHLAPTLLDSERLAALSEEGQRNPFEQCQLAICSLATVTEPHWCELAERAGWDLLVVDEAHHLRWESDPALVSSEYRAIERLAQRTSGLLLLTATPQQLGAQSHFARLRLLDPERFSSLTDYQRQQAQLTPLAAAIDQIETGQLLCPASQTLLDKLLDPSEQALLSAQQADPTNRDRQAELAELLLDRHGTGRVLLRNSRAAIGGFAARRAHLALLPAPPQYDAAALASPTPERHYREGGGSDWTRIDPRVDWLLKLLKQCRNSKLLVIIHCAESALDLVDFLRIRRGLLAAVFHPKMSVVERDRAAAMFADDPECPLLVCSEIGSEGRNFQFAHQLVLFDLPANPDLLEQRIGRLDRIGQQQTVEIHLPMLAGSRQQTLLRWHSEAANSIEHYNPAAEPLYREYAAELADLAPHSTELDRLIEDAAARNRQLQAELASGRDRLLERNSCRQPHADRLAAALRASDGDPALTSYLALLLDSWGVEREPLDQHSWALRPSSEMSEPFPELDDDGISVTFDRDTALQREELAFLSWDHPMVVAASERLLHSSRGNATLAALDGRPLQQAGIASGAVLVELCFVLEAPDANRRYLPPTPARWLFDERGRDLAGPLTPAILAKLCKPVGRRLAAQAVKSKQAELRSLIALGERTAAAASPALIAAAMAAAEQQLEAEAERLRALARRNPLFDPAELQALAAEQRQLADRLERLQLRLDAVRVIVVT